MNLRLMDAFAYLLCQAAPPKAAQALIEAHAEQPGGYVTKSRCAAKGHSQSNAHKALMGARGKHTVIVMGLCVHLLLYLPHSPLGKGTAATVTYSTSTAR